MQNSLGDITCGLQEYLLPLKWNALEQEGFNLHVNFLTNKQKTNKINKKAVTIKRKSKNDCVRKGNYAPLKV